MANVLPIVSLADTFTAKELTEYKRLIMDMALVQEVKFYNCIDSLRDLVTSDTELDKIRGSLLTSRVSGQCPPFAIVNPQF